MTFRKSAASSGRLTDLAVPDWLRADVDRRLLTHGESRARRAAARPRRRAVASMRAWAAFAAICLPVAAIETAWGWVVAAGLAAARAGLSWREARRLAAAEDAGLALPTVPAPAITALRRSAAAAPLRGGESALMALATVVRSLPPGPVGEQGRAAMAAAATTVDTLREQAARVIACERVARAATDPGRRADAQAHADALVATMRADADGLDELLGAASDLVTALPADRPEIHHLTARTDTLRGIAEALRDLSAPR